MIILIIGILLILYGISAKNYSVAFGMLFVLIIMGLQEGIPGDYMTYKYAFEHGGADPDDIERTAKETEYSMVWLAQTMSRFMNFHWFVFITSLIQCFAMGVMIKDYADKRYWNFGVLLVFFTYNIMLIHMKAMRQGYAVDCLLLAYWLIGKRRFFTSLLMAIIAYGFHNSSIMAMPFFVVLFVMMFVRRKEKVNKCINAVKIDRKAFKYASFVAIGLFIFTILKFTIIDTYVAPLVSTLDFLEYGYYLGDIENRGLAWWIVLYSVVITFAAAVYFISEKDIIKKYFAFLTVASGFVYIGFFGMGSLFRLSMYFDIFAIVTLPNIAGMLKNTYGKRIALYFIMFNMTYLMYLSVMHMVSMKVQDGFGYGMFKFSFLS